MTRTSGLIAVPLAAMAPTTVDWLYYAGTGTLTWPALTAATVYALLPTRHPHE